jgi:chromosome segregation ATPase
VIVHAAPLANTIKNAFEVSRFHIVYRDSVDQIDGTAPGSISDAMKAFGPEEKRTERLCPKWSDAKLSSARFWRANDRFLQKTLSISTEYIIGILRKWEFNGRMDSGDTVPSSSGPKPVHDSAATEIELRQIIGSLSRDNAVLKSQFADAVSVAARFQEISDANAELSKKAHLLESNNEGLNQRIQILEAKNGELRSRAAAQPEAQPRRNDIEVVQLRHQLDETRAQSKQLIADLEHRLRAAETALDAAELKFVHSTNEMKSVLSAASEHFSISLSDADSLISQLLKKPLLVEVLPRVTDDRRLKRKIDRLRTQLRRSERSAESLSSQLREKELEFDAEKAALIETNRQLAHKIEGSSRQKKLLESEIQTTRAQLEICHDRPIETRDEYREKWLALRAKHEELRQQLSAAVARVAFLENRRRLAKKQIKEFKIRVEELSGSLEQVQMERSNLYEKVRRYSIERESYQDQIGGLSEQQSEICRLKEDNEKLNSALKSCETLILKQTFEVRNLEDNRAKLVACVQKLSQVLQKFEGLSVQNGREKEIVRVEVPVEERVPISVRNLPRISQNLGEIVDEIGANIHMKTEAKVRQILRLLGEFYEGELAQLEKRLEVLLLDSRQRAEAFHSSFPDIAWDDPNASQILQARFKDLAREKDELSAQLTEKGNCLANLLLALQAASPEEARTTLSQLTSTVDHLRSQIAVSRRKLRAARRSVSETLARLETLASRFQDEEKEKEALQAEVADLTNRVLESSRVQEIERQDIQRQATIRELESRLERELERGRAARVEVEGRDEQIRALTRLAETLKQRNQHLSRKVEKVRDDLEQATRRHREDMSAVQERCQQQVDGLELKNSEFEMAVDDLNAAIAEADGKNSRHVRELEQFELKIASLERELEREKQLNEAQAQALATARDCDFRHQLSEYQNECDRNKRDLMSFVGLEFCSIVDLSEKITEESFRVVIQRLRREFETLAKQDRNLRLLLSLAPAQSIEDEIARLLLRSPTLSK